MTTNTSSPDTVELKGVSQLTRNRRMRVLFLVGALALLELVFSMSLWVGAKDLGFSEVWHVLWNRDDSEASYIVHEMRIPRALIAIMVGAALGVSGALIQALTRNPLADTGILGVGAGASFAIVLGIGFFGATALADYMWFSFIGAILVTVVVYVLGSIGDVGATPIRLTLVGVALGALLSGFTSAVVMLNPDVFDRALRWNAGSIAGRGWPVLHVVWVPILVGLFIGILSARALNSIALGDDIAKAQGVSVLRSRVLVIVSVTLLAGAATAAAGPIGFLGLMVPHVVRWFTGPDQRWIVPYSALGVAVLLLAADVLGRVILYPRELEVGIISAVVGAPILILLARRKSVSTL